MVIGVFCDENPENMLYNRLIDYTSWLQFDTIINGKCISTKSCTDDLSATPILKIKLLQGTFHHKKKALKRKSYLKPFLSFIMNWLLVIVT